MVYLDDIICLRYTILVQNRQSVVFVLTYLGCLRVVFFLVMNVFVVALYFFVLVEISITLSLLRLERNCGSKQFQLWFLQHSAERKAE